MSELPPTDPATERRLHEAFSALLTSEVPATAPRPAQAPRPPRAGGGRAHRRRWQLAGGSLLAVAAAVVIALVVGTEVNDARTRPTAPPATQSRSPEAPTTPATPTTPTTPTTPPTTPGTTVSTPRSTPPTSLGEVTTAFQGVSRSTRSSVVVVPGGFEGADLDAGTIRFWRWAGSSWVVDDTSSYPADAYAGTTARKYSATLTAAALLPAMDHAVFVVTDEFFTGDGTGFTLAYTDGPAGWGIVKAGSDGALHPSGAGLPALGTTDAANIGLSYGEDLVNGYLRTTDCSKTAPDDASCGSVQYDVVKYWRWDGDRFVLDHRSGPAS